jgi:hypothetical protein
VLCFKHYSSINEDFSNPLAESSLREHIFISNTALYPWDSRGDGSDLAIGANGPTAIARP